MHQRSKVDRNPSTGAAAFQRLPRFRDRRLKCLPCQIRRQRGQGLTFSQFNTFSIGTMLVFFAGVGAFLFGPVLLASLLEGVSPGWIAVKRAESISASHHERNTLEATFTTELNHARLKIAAQNEK